MGLSMVFIDTSAKGSRKATPKQSKPSNAAGCLVFFIFVGGCVLWQEHARKQQGIDSDAAQGWVERKVGRERFGQAWPLTVAAGRVRVYDGIYITFIDQRGNEYAVNGSAKACGFPSIDPIWRNGDVLPKVNIDPLFEVARELGHHAATVSQKFELMRTIGRPAPGGRRVRSN